MKFLLDTNICSAHLRRPGGLAHRFFQYSGRLLVSTVVIAEMHAWAHKRSDPQPLLVAIDRFLEDVAVLDFDRTCAEKFGMLRGQFLAKGIKFPLFDLQIAATAIAHDLTLVTHNTADFQRIPGLQLVDWLLP